MHVEFKVSQISNICAFNAEQFYSVRDLVLRNASTESEGAQRNMPYSRIAKRAANQTGNATLPPSLSNFEQTASRLYSSKSKLAMEQTMHSNPRLRVQFILERIVKLETTDLVAKSERIGRENKQKLNSGDSEVRIMRYKVSPNEAILASFPSSTADCVVKIRLIQLPPLPITSSTKKTPLVEIDTSPNSKLSSKDSLCIGVAKITLRELIMIRSGVRMVLQPKQSIARAVGELTQSAGATNRILGKDVGGSASLTFQVLSYSFGNVSHPVLLLYHESKLKPYPNDDVDTASSNTYSERFRGASNFPVYGLLNPFDAPRRTASSDGFQTNSGVPRSVDSSTSSCESQHAVNDLHLDSPAIRFVLIPYVALAILFLRLHDVILWRKPLETFNTVALLIFAIYVNMLNVASVLICFAYLIIFMKTMGKLYHIPIVDLNSGSLVSEPFLKGTSRNVLYSRRYTFLNALVRAKLFFCQGLQEDSFYELALAFHIIRNYKLNFVVKVALLCVGMCFVPAELFTSMVIFGVFFLYPISFRLPTIRNSKKKQSKTPLRFSDLLNAYRVNQPMYISRVVKVIVVSPRPDNNLEALKMDTFTTRTSRPSSQKAGNNEGKSYVQHLSNLRPQRADSLVTDYMNADAVERQQQINVMRLSFALIVITDNDPASNIIFLKLLAHFRNLHHLKVKPNDDSTGNAEGAETGTLANDSNSSPPINMEGAFGNFFVQTVNLLNYIKRNALLQTYVSPSCALHTGNLIPLELLAHPLWLVEEGKDDGITATIKAMSKRDSIKVGKIGSHEGIDNDARSMALLAAYLLQGFSLSVYSQGEHNAACAIIFPLKPSLNGFQAAPRPNPCPPHLLQALEEIWLGGKHFKVQKGIPIGIDLVLKIICTYKDRRTGRMQSFDSSGVAEQSSLISQPSLLHNFTSRKAPSFKHNRAASNLPPTAVGVSSYGSLPLYSNNQKNVDQEVNLKPNALSAILTSQSDGNPEPTTKETRKRLQSEKGV
ncbi:unnamed protein product [Phytomonas sp. EM1]|nr:unnamed protein product [Phytomonas sp. EM1]|eukprot:CCW60471.1 unnamed protein product [Phytomonas sp. isolate EM1]